MKGFTMFAMFKTLVAGNAARSEAKLRDHYALDLIDQKIRETEAALKAAKATLAMQIQRLRAESNQFDIITARIKSLIERTRKAITADNAPLAHDGATAIAELENEATVRNTTIERLKHQIERIRLSVEKAQCKVVDLKQGYISAKSVRSEQAASTAVARTLPNAPAREAQELIDEVLAKDSPSDLADIYEEIEDRVSHKSIEERMGDAGFGDKLKVSAADVLARFTPKMAKPAK